MKVNLQFIAIAFVVLVAVTNGKEIQTGAKSEGVVQRHYADFVIPRASVAVVTPGTSVLVDCRLTDPSAKVVLFFTPVLNEPFQDISRHINVVAAGQIFMLNEVDLSDDGYYMCERKDKQGKANVMLELFVLEEESIYNSCILKHVFENETVGNLGICKTFLRDGFLDKGNLCGTFESPTTETIKGVGEIAANVGALDSARKDIDETVAWLKDRVAISTWNTVDKTTSTYRDDIFMVYGNGLWNTSSQAVSRCKDRVKGAIFKAYKNTSWNTMFLAADVIVGLQDSMGSYFSKEPCDALKALVVDSLMILKCALTWLFDTTEYLISVYMEILSDIMVGFQKCIEQFISEQHKMELRNDVDGLVTWCSDVILVIRLMITWLVNNVAMVIMAISEVIYPRNDLFSILTPDGRFDQEMFWQAARMDLMEFVFRTTKSLTTRFIYSKIHRAAVRGAIVYKDAIFSDSRAYNVMVLLVYACIFVVCRLRLKIAALLQPWTKRSRKYILTLWRQLTKTLDKKHRVFVLSCVRRTKMLRDKPQHLVVNKSDHMLYMTESGSMSLIAL